VELSETEIIDKIGRMLRTPEGELLMTKVREKHRYFLSILRNTTDLVEMGRAQGQLFVLAWILELRSGNGVLE
jgi:hypothetical protein